MNPLQERLAAVRRRSTRIVSFRGGCWSIAVLLLSVGISWMLDWQLHLPGLVRAVLLVAILAGTGCVALWLLVRPLSQRTDDLSLALRVEEIYPFLNDSLASTVQFLEQSEQSPDSQGLRQEAVKRTLRQVEDYDFRRVVSGRGVFSSFLAMAATCTLAVLFVTSNPSLARIALLRLAHPFGDVDWPPQTRVEITDYRDKIAQGKPYSIQGVVSGVIPEHASIEIEYEGSTTGRGLAVPKQEMIHDGKFSTRLTEDEAGRNFRFRVLANDATSKWLPVIVQAPPVLAPLDGLPSPHVQLNYPAYTDLPAPQPMYGNGNVRAVLGTSVSLRAAADRPLSRAWIEYRPRPALVPQALAVGLATANRPASAIALTAAGNEVWGRVSARVASDGLSFSVDFLPRVSGMYALRFEDTSGLDNVRLFELEVKSDPAPIVDLQRPSHSHDSLFLLPSADIAVQVQAQDREYALRSVWMTYVCRTSSGVVDPPGRLLLYDHQTIGTTLPALGSRLAGLPLALPAPPLRLRPRQLSMARRLSLTQIKHANGAALQEGDIVTLQACADDFDDVAVDKIPGCSSEIELTIVGRPALEAMLNREQTRVQEELVRLRKQQQEALDRVIAAEQRWRNLGRLRDQDVEQLLQAKELQQQVRARIDGEESKQNDRDRPAPKQEGLRTEVERILRALRDNQLPRSGTHDRMGMVASELERLAREELPPIEPGLANALKENENAAARPKSKEQKGTLAEARKHQEEVENTLNELLKLLEPWGHISAVKGEARDLREKQRQLNDEVANLDKSDARGKKITELTPEQKDALDRSAEMQRRLSERTGQLLEQMKRAAEDLKEKDPESSQALREATQKGLEKGLKEQMQNAGQSLRDNRLGEAKKDQKAISQTLEEISQALEDRRERELQQLRNKLKESDDKLKDLERRQGELRKKVKEAGQIADPAKRAEALKRLAEEQEKLQKEAQERIRELKMLRAERAGSSLEKARESMERASRRLEQGEDPDEEEEETLNRLNEARRQVDQAQDEVEEELAREKLAKVADQIKLLKERQESTIAESERIHKEAMSRKRWDRGQLINLRALYDVQNGLAQETKSLSKGKLAPAKVFASILLKAAAAMNQAAQRIDGKIKDHAGEPEADKELNRLQREAVRRLDQLLDVLKTEKGMAAAPAGDDDKGEPPGGKSEKPRGNEGIAQVAQLKLLRTLQKEVNERTAEFGKRFPDVNKLKPDQHRELTSIRKDQEELADLLDELTAPAEPEGDKK